MGCAVVRIGPAFSPVGGVASRHRGLSPTFPRLSPATPWAYERCTHGSHEPGVCGSGSLGEKGATLRVRAGATGRPIPGALVTTHSTRWSLRGVRAN